MPSRLDLHELLKSLSGLTNVYFQPPTSIQLVYPCIVYGLSDIDVQYADNISYAQMREYLVTVIDKNPDTAIPDNLLKSLERCSFERTYITDNLNHFVLRLFY